MRTTIQPVTEADIERLYADPSLSIDLSTAVIEHQVRRGRVLRSQMAAGFIRQGLVATWRFVTHLGRPSGRLTPSNV